MPGDERKFGITTPGRSGKAVRRNRIKRIMRETYRLNSDKFPAKGSILYVVKRCDKEEEIIPDMLTLAKYFMEGTD